MKYGRQMEMNIEVGRRAFTAIVDFRMMRCGLRKLAYLIIENKLMECNEELVWVNKHASNQI